jgi:hypothetical protein
MSWSSLLPSTLKPRVLLDRLSAGGEGASEAFRDSIILFAIVVVCVFAIWVLGQTLASWRHTRQYLKVLHTTEAAADAVLNSNLPLFTELKHHLIDVPSTDGTGRVIKRRTVDAAEVLRELALGPSFITSRLILAIPSILTGLGVLGTFVGLQLGISSLSGHGHSAPHAALFNHRLQEEPSGEIGDNFARTEVLKKHRGILKLCLAGAGRCF